MFHQMLMEALAVLTGSPPPIPHRTFIEPKRMDDRLDRTTVHQQSDDQQDRFWLCAQSIKECAPTGTKCLFTDMADVATFFAIVHPNIPSSYFPSCRTLQIRAK
jgi:hypothetical protein